jgi:hypothetical protein
VRHRQVLVTLDPQRQRMIVSCACGQAYAVPAPSTAALADLLQRAEQAHTTGAPGLCQAGCHYASHGLADFDHYIDVHGISPAQAAEAFADYLALEYGWDGQFERVEFPEGSTS